MSLFAPYLTPPPLPAHTATPHFRVIGGPDVLKRTIYQEEHLLFLKQCERFFEKEIKPFHDEWERDGVVPKDAWRAAGRAGLLCPSVPEIYGGPGADFLYHACATEAQGRAGASGPGFSIHSDIVAPYVLNHGSEEQKRQWLPGMVSGETIAAIAMTEPGTGSDLQGIQTTARRDGDDWIINGAKTFISNGQLADICIIVARTNPDAGSRGFSLFLVESTEPGYQRGRNLEKIGMKAQDTSELFFENLRVPSTALLGEEGMGFSYLMQELAQERLSIALLATAGAEMALQVTIDYVAERKAFNQAIGAFQATRFTIAELATKAQVTRSFVDQCTLAHLDGALDISTAAMAKLWATEVQGHVVDAGLQLHGGYGYMWEYPIARAYADARIQRIYGGTSEIMKELISRAVLDPVVKARQGSSSR